jgi:subtilisin-like proprotein convertase family protein
MPVETDFIHPANLSISYYSPLQSSVLVHGYPNGTNISEHYTVALYFEELSHTWIGDLVVKLKKNDRTLIVMNRPGMNGSGYGSMANGFKNVVIRDPSIDENLPSIHAIPAGDVMVENMTYFPDDGTNQSFFSSTFDGVELNGNWELEIKDEGRADNGFLVKWGIRVYSPDETTATNCFTGEAKLKTDQGLIQIKDVSIKNTIDNKKIKGISKTIWPMDKIVVIEKHALGHNYPSTKTKVAPTHRFLINETLQPIMNFINNENIYLTKYKNETLYNVIIGENETMKVNNMVVESLDPNTLIAKVFNGSLDASQKNRLIKSLNKYHNKLKNKQNKTIRDYRV